MHGNTKRSCFVSYQKLYFVSEVHIVKGIKYLFSSLLITLSLPFKVFPPKISKIRQYRNKSVISGMLCFHNLQQLITCRC